MSKTHRGLAPAATEVRKKRTEGYLTVAAAAAHFKVSVFTLYRWARPWRPTKTNQFGRSFDGKLGAYKDGANLWILVAAVETMLKARDERTKFQGVVS